MSAFESCATTSETERIANMQNAEVETIPKYWPYGLRPRTSPKHEMFARQEHGPNTMASGLGWHEHVVGLVLGCFPNPPCPPGTTRNRPAQSGPWAGTRPSSPTGPLTYKATCFPPNSSLPSLPPSPSSSVSPPPPSFSILPLLVRHLLRRCRRHLLCRRCLFLLAFQATTTPPLPPCAWR